jgi:hypothetical protein
MGESESSCIKFLTSKFAEQPKLPSREETLRLLAKYNFPQNAPTPEKPAAKTPCPAPIAPAVDIIAPKRRTRKLSDAQVAERHKAIDALLLDGFTQNETSKITKSNINMVSARAKALGIGRRQYRPRRAQNVQPSQADKWQRAFDDFQNALDSFKIFIKHNTPPTNG